MAKKILIIVAIVLTSIICLFGIHYLFNGGLQTFSDTAKEVSLWQAIKDFFVGIYKGFTKTIGL